MAVVWRFHGLHVVGLYASAAHLFIGPRERSLLGKSVVPNSGGVMVFGELLRHSAAAFAGCVVGVLVGAQDGRAELAADAATRHTERVAKRAAFHDPHGDEDPFKAIPVFDVLEKSADGVSGAFHLEVDNLRPVELRVAYSWELTTDGGVVIASGVGPLVGHVAAQSFLSAESWPFPKLQDGFYRTVFTVASGGNIADTKTVQLVDWWLEVNNGSIQELTSTEWLARAPSAISAVEVKP